MAGYLGTLFMANVGMRLLLPPRSQFTQAATQFGKLVKGIEQHHSRYYTKAGEANSRTLKKVLHRSNQLAKKHAEEGGKATLGQLSRNLNEIARLTKTKNRALIQSTKKDTWATTAALAKGHKGVSSDKFWKANEAGLKQLQIQMAEGERRAQSFSFQWWRMADLIGQTGAYLMGTFRQALAVSITGLTTLGYTIRGLSQDFGVFERELINANSIWQVSNETLYDISDRVIKFGEDYGFKGCFNINYGCAGRC